MEWKEFILLFFGILVVLFLGLSIISVATVSKLENVNINFEIEPNTRDLINRIQNDSSEISNQELINALDNWAENNCEDAPVYILFYDTQLINGTLKKYWNCRNGDKYSILE